METGDRLTAAREKGENWDNYNRINKNKIKLKKRKCA